MEDHLKAKLREHLEAQIAALEKRIKELELDVTHLQKWAEIVVRYMETN